MERLATRNNPRRARTKSLEFSFCSFLFWCVWAYSLEPTTGIDIISELRSRELPRNFLAATASSVKWMVTLLRETWCAMRFIFLKIIFLEKQNLISELLTWRFSAVDIRHISMNSSRLFPLNFQKPATCIFEHSKKRARPQVLHLHAPHCRSCLPELEFGFGMRKCRPKHDLPYRAGSIHRYDRT